MTGYETNKMMKDVSWQCSTMEMFNIIIDSVKLYTVS